MEDIWIYVAVFIAGLVIGYAIRSAVQLWEIDGDLFVDLNNGGEPLMYLAISEVPKTNYVRMKVNKINLKPPEDPKKYNS